MHMYSFFEISGYEGIHCNSNKKQLQNVFVSSILRRDVIPFKSISICKFYKRKCLPHETDIK